MAQIAAAPLVMSSAHQLCAAALSRADEHPVGFVQAEGRDPKFPLCWVL